MLRELDIPTLVIIIGITHLIQVLVFLYQYAVNKSFKGPGWWLLWSASEVLGFSFILGRSDPATLPLVIILQNSLIVVGTIFLYAGVTQFLDKKVNKGLIIPLLAVFVTGLLYFLFIDNKIQVRTSLISFTLACISFATAHALLTNKIRAIKVSARVNAFIFLVHGIFFAIRSMMVLQVSPVENILIPSALNILPFIDALVVSLLWTFGLIIMLSQRLGAGMFEANEDLQSIFNTSPDAAIITRLDDGFIVDVNQGYTAITGYSKEDLADKSTIDIHIWKDVADRQNVVKLIREQGYCENYEAVFVRKDGREITGLMSARLMKLQGVPHIISISRDITERKLAEENLRFNEKLYRSTLDNILEGCQIIGFDWRYIYLNKTAELHNRRRNEELLGRTFMEIWPGIEQTAVYHVIRHALNERIPHQMEYEFTFPDSTTGWFDLSIQPSSEGVFIMSIDITERKKAEDGLRESEQKFREIILNLDEGFYSTTPEGILLEHNQGFNRILDFDETVDLRGQFLPNFWLFPDKRQAYLEILRAAGSVSNYPIEIRTTTGKHISIIASAHLVKNKDGQPLRIEGVFLDITERIASEEKVLKIGQHYQRLFEKAPDGIVLIDIKGEFKFISPTARKIFGYGPTEAVEGSNPAEFTHPEDLPMVLSALTNLMAEPSYIPVLQYRFATRTGEWRWVESTFSNLLDDPSVEAIVINFRDITERKLDEIALQASETKYRALIQSLQVGIVAHGPDTSILFSNPMASELLGLTPDQMFGKTAIDPAWCFIREDRTKLKVEEYPVNLAMASDNHFDDLFLGIMRPDKSDPVWVQCNAHKIFSPDGQLMQVVVSFFNITGRKKAESDLKTLNETLEQRVVQRTAQLEALNKELESFSYSVSHDLRAPLRHISGYVNLVLERFYDSVPEKGKHYLNTISDAANQMGILIDDLLQFSRTGRQELRITDVDMNLLVAEAMESIAKDCKEREISWIVAQLPHVEGDPAMMKQVWINLLSNAAKFTRRKDQAMIDITFVQDQKEYIFSVKDNGAGFDMQYSHKLFGVFQRLHSATEFEGTGIGLANVYRIIQKHGGRTWAESMPEHGATFYFSLPINMEA
ncbi:MAG: PAS domain-containing sensor histidine kinase [Bacteroidales bacterium]